MAKVQAPSGFRDFAPDQHRKRLELIERIRRVYESFGFQGMETPAAENLGVLLGKAGGENEKLMFRVLKRGAELQRALEKQDELADLGLRFDLTLPLARFYATHRGTLPAVFKRYQIGPTWRAERPQAGRYREFIQCDVDILGSSSALAEADVILATTTALAELGFRGLCVRLNSRPLLARLALKTGAPEPAVGGVFISLDKLDKAAPQEVEAEMAARGAPQAAARALLELHAATAPLDSHARLALVEERVGPDGAPLVARVREIMNLTPPLPGGRLVFEPFLARGMDYYTGPIFEINAEGAQFALAGGGRYDDLVGAFCGQPVPAVGFSIGFERVFALMDERAMFGAPVAATDALLAVPDDSVAAEALKLAGELRAAGLKVDFFPGAGKLPQQFELAEKKGLRWAVIADSAALAAGNLNVRDLSARRNTPVPRNEVAAWLKARLAK